MTVRDIKSEVLTNEGNEMVFTENSNNLYDQKITEESYGEKKSRKSYSAAKKAEIINGYFNSKAENEKLSIGAYAKEVGIGKTMIWRWILEKDNIFEKAGSNYKNMENNAEIYNVDNDFDSMEESFNMNEQKVSVEDISKYHEMTSNDRFTSIYENRLDSIGKSNY